VAGGKEQLLQSAAREGSMAPWSLTGRKAEDLCHGRDDRLFSAHGGSSEMPPFHCALKVRHAVAQRAPQKQKLGLLRQGKGLALVDKRNNLLGSAAELSLYIVVVAYVSSYRGSLQNMAHSYAHTKHALTGKQAK
jgi:hypothetical protein